ncbi:vWA domain-containing protein [Pelagibacterium montanilacus]|uniref:vWA domain-containing protein n=1 Tax=Pelagibacterium montanilacus TaxID=2185280 RepID=UPI000F8CF45C|nr:hypothetical protein [Pelagibacterium montanilacus]
MRRHVGRFGLAFALGALTTLSAPASAQDANGASVLIYDASGSMWGQLEGGITKVEVAREVIGDFFTRRDNAEPLGVIAYGHNRRGDCADIEVIADVGINDPAGLSSNLNRLNPRGMTPITDSLSLAASMIPPTAESADIILVTDGLETCDADPCALAAQLAEEGISIRAHVVGFALTDEEAEAMRCVAEATGGLLLAPQSGQELADALNQIAEAEPAPEPEPQPVAEAFFDIGPKAEAGHDYRISFEGTARNVDYAGFTRRGAGQPDVGPSYGVLGGAEVGNNPFTRRAPLEPGEYDLILAVTGQGIIARQPIEVVPPSNGFDAIGSVEPDARFEFTWRGPNQVGQRLVIARPGAAPNDYFPSWGYPYSNRQTQRMGLTAPVEPGIYELRYISGNQQEILFSREFGVGVPFEDTDATNTADLADQAAAATQAAPGQDAMPMVKATFRTPDNFPQIPLWWDAIPLDPDMSQEAYAPISELVVWENEFEPGRYRVSAIGPGETEFSAVVEIFPGQPNDFVVPVSSASEEDEGSVVGLSGGWQMWAIPPRDAPAGAPTDPIEMARVSLTINAEATAYGGVFTPTGAMVGAGDAAGVPFESVSEEEGYLFLRFALPALSPEPFVVSLAPYGNGFSGTMDSGANGLPVVFWPADESLPSMPDMQDHLYGPTVGQTDDPGPLQETPAAVPGACEEDICFVSDEATGLAAQLPRGWLMWQIERVDGQLLAQFTNGESILMLIPSASWNPENGPCFESAAGPVCYWAEGDPGARLAAPFIAANLRIEPQEDASAPASGGEVDLSDFIGELATVLVPQTSALEGADDRIRVRLKPETQFGSGCFIAADLAQRGHEPFTLVAGLSAQANDAPVTSVLNPDEPMVLEIDAFTDRGAALSPVMMMSACDAIALTVGPIQCRMGTDSAAPLQACPLPVEVSTSGALAALSVAGEASAGTPAELQAPIVQPDEAAMTGEVIPVDIGDMSPEELLSVLLPFQPES